MENPTRLFKSDAHMIAFALLYTDAWLRADLLGITEDLYHSKVAAEEWRDDLLSRLDGRPALNEDDYLLAKDKIRVMYKSMVGGKRK